MGCSVADDTGEKYHVAPTRDRTAVRIDLRVDGQPRWRCVLSRDGGLVIAPHEEPRAIPVFVLEWALTELAGLAPAEAAPVARTVMWGGTM
jgi:hypothetical protein